MAFRDAPAPESRAEDVTASGGGLSAGSHSAAGRTTSCSTRCWPRAALHGATEPDLLEEATRWQSDDFWEYALYAAVSYIRAVASQAGVPVRQTCQDLAQPQATPSHNTHHGAAREDHTDQ